jgi:hypothetical protein
MSHSGSWKSSGTIAVQVPNVGRETAKRNRPGEGGAIEDSQIVGWWSKTRSATYQTSG